MQALINEKAQQVWNQSEFEIPGNDGVVSRWRWVDAPGKNIYKLRCALGERYMQLLDIQNSNCIETTEQQIQDCFVNLHGHTEHSDGLMSVEEYIDRVDALGQDALAITDHGTMGGVAKFLLACKKKGKKGIAGNELYMRVPELTKHLRESDLKGDYKVKDTFHQLAIALTPQGYKNLSKLTTLANTVEAKKAKVINFEQLKQYQEGLVVTSGCVAGVIPQLILLGKTEMALQWATYYQETWGDRFYIELQDHQQPMYVELNKALVKISEQLGIEPIITADSHYLTSEDYLSHSIFQAIKWGKTLDDPARLAYDSDLFVSKGNDLTKRFSYLPSSVLEKAIKNTQIIANCVEDYNIFRQPTMPKFPIPNGYQDNNEYLAVLAQKYLNKRFPKGYSQEYSDRLAFELKTIIQMGFADYFLVVWDAVRFAKDKKIPVGPGRGSAAGSLVTYALQITNVDPVHHGLIFERFLNPERVSMPDIDLDFCPERRKEVVDYVISKYGQEYVAQLSTSTTMQSKGVLKDVGRVLDIPLKERDALCKLIPSSRGKTPTLAKMLNQSLAKFKPKERKLVEEFRDLYNNDEKIKDWINKALPLEGKQKTIGIHAAALVIGDVPIVEFTSLRRGEDGVLATECSMVEIEELGGVKMDFLALANLTLLQNAVNLVREDFGIEINLDDITWHDPKIFELFATGDTDGIFQFESDGMKQMLMRIKPTVFEDIVAANALFRPGPLDSGMVDRFVDRKHGRCEVTYPSDSVKPFLEPTYGEAIYQEQLMKIAQEIAGFTLGQADLLRRACGKKKMSEMIKHEKMFVDGCLSQGHNEELAKELWEIIKNSAEYSFNRSHSLAYGRCAFQCAYFKLYYPLQFMAALISMNTKEAETLSQYLNVASRRSIKVLPPDINNSGSEFKTHEGSILYGFKGIKQLNDGGITPILNARTEKPFESLADFCDRVALSAGCIESLIKVGAFDALISNRASAVAALPSIHEWATKKRDKNKKTDQNQLALFSFSDFQEPAPKIKEKPEYSNVELLEFEKEILGIYLSGHPLDALPEGKPLVDLKVKQKLRVSVQIIACYPKESKKGIFANLDLEDKWGNTIKGVCWAEEYLKYSYALDKGTFVHLEGKITEWNERLQFCVTNVLS